MMRNAGVTGMVMMGNSSLGLRLPSTSSGHRRSAFGYAQASGRFDFRSLSVVEGPGQNRITRIALGLILFCTLAVASPDSAFWKPPVFSRLDSLFIVAATGEPKFEKERDSSQKVLLSLDTVGLQYLLDHRLTGQTPRQRHYVETFFMLASDSGRNSKPRLLLSRALSLSPDTIRSQLLYIGSEMRDTAFRRAAVSYLHSDSSGVRRMAARCLGSYPHPENLPLLWDRLESTRGLELQQRLWALDAQGPLLDWKRLTPLLCDSMFFNRQKVRDMLLKSTDSSWMRLKEAVPAKMEIAERLEWCLLALDAKGGGEFLDSALPQLNEEEGRLLNRYRKTKP